MNLEGSVAVESMSSHGKSISISSLGAGEVFGEMAVLCDIPRTAGIGAKTDLEVLRIERDAFLKLLSEFPDVALQVTKFLAARLEATNQALRLGAFDFIVISEM